MIATAQTWDCGTFKSQSNVFNWYVPTDREKLEADELRKAKDRARKAKMKKDAMRVNRETFLGAHGGIANSLKGR